MLSTETMRQSVSVVSRTHSTAGTRSIVSASPASSPEKHKNSDGSLMQISSLLREAQNQVMELLPHKEENSRLSTELALLKERVRSKEEECRKLQHALNSERDDRHRVVKAMMDEGGAVNAAGEQRIRRLEEQLLEKKSEISSLQRDFERKVAHAKSLEEDLAYCRQQRQDESQKSSQASAGVLMMQQKVSFAEKRAEDLSRDLSRVEELNKNLTAQLQESESQLSLVRHELDQSRKKRNELSAENTHLQGQVAELNEKCADFHQIASALQQLRTEHASLLSMRDELQEMRKLLDSSNTAFQAERSSRRSIESERDEVRLRASALSSEVEILQAELHRARCDAAERLALRSECEETRKALDAAYRSTGDLQEKLQEVRRELAERNADIESANSALTREITVLRTALESGVNSEDLLKSLNSQTSLIRTQMSETSGLVHDSAPVPDMSSRMQPVIWALQPLRRMIVEVNKSCEEDRLKHISTSRQLESERTKVHNLEENLRIANLEASQLQLKLQETSSRLSNALNDLRLAQDTIREHEGTTSRRLSALSDVLRLDPGCTGWESIFTAASRASEEVAAQKLELQRLGETTSLQTKQLIALKKQAEVDRAEIEASSARRMGEVAAAHLVTVSEANEEKAALREALKREADRHEGTAKELSASRLNHQATAHALATMQIQRDSLQAEIEALRKQQEHSHLMIESEQKDKQALTEALQLETLRHSSVAKQLQEVTSDAIRQKELTCQVHSVAETLLRGLLWYRAKTKVILKERNFACQMCLVIEDALTAAVRDRAIAKPKTSMRSAVIAVLAANRLLRLALQQNLSRRSLSPNRGTRTRHEHMTLPTILPTAPSQLVAVLTADPADTIRQLEALAEVSAERRSYSDRYDLDFAFFWKLCSRAKMSGTSLIPKLLCAAIRKVDCDLAESRKMVTRMESECSSLRSLIETKENEIQTCNSQLARSLAERTLLVDKRHVDHLQYELSQVRSSLAKERSEKQHVEEVAQQLRAREAELMTAQAELQSEARSLAIELAHRTASVDAVSALRTHQHKSRTLSTSIVGKGNSMHHGTLAGDESVYTSHSENSTSLMAESSKKRLAAIERAGTQHPPDRVHDQRALWESHNTSAGDLFKMISEIDSRISEALRQP